MELRKLIENHIPYDEIEEKDKKQFLRFIDKFNDVLTRDNTIGHFSASAFVLNKEKTKTLVVYHIINDGWTYPGGHADGEDDLLNVALREVEEETGLESKPLSNEPFLISSNPVKGHIKRGKFVSSHLHFDVLYLVEADDTIPLSYREEESKGIKWIPLEEADDESMCDFIRINNQRIIKKLKYTK